MLQLLYNAEVADLWGSHKHSSVNTVKVHQWMSAVIINSCVTNASKLQAYLKHAQVQSRP